MAKCIVPAPEFECPGPSYPAPFDSPTLNSHQRDLFFRDLGCRSK